ncbi:MAG: FAD-dependent oxidoreductase [Flavobacteriaceae bacterium]|nr:FAD-dependent oxidoreductase [Flavobacteriaceae bacterium]
MNVKFLIFTFSILFVSCSKPNYDVIIVGGGASGITSAIQASRLGSKTLLIEKTDWLGGMLTSAGVSAIDGNYKMPSGFLKEFRDSLVSYYGSLESLKSGWVSNVMFEPSVGNDILNSIAESENNLSVTFNSTIKNIREIDDKWEINITTNGNIKKVKSKILIDATELGDLIPKLKIPYSVGMDSKNHYNEEIAPSESNDIIQDLTYVMILKDFKKDVTINKPANYNRDEFLCSYDSNECTSSDLKLWPKEDLISYGKLPNEKFMINWPIFGNDYYFNSIEMNENDRLYHYNKAKEKSLRFLYFIQSELGYNNLSIDKQEFLTSDGFAKIPYHRESRRMVGKVTLDLNYIKEPYSQKYPLYRTGIAVGDYPVDHHHNAHPKYKELPKLDFYPIPSYSVPIGSLIPENQQNFIVIEKSISVSNLVNGTTRLQPVVMQVGQAAGILASLAASQNKNIDLISIREVQLEILKNKGYIQPFVDVSSDHPNFRSYQKIGACGILKGKGMNVGWENKTLFYPENNLSKEDLDFSNYYSLDEHPLPQSLTISNILDWINQININEKINYKPETFLKDLGLEKMDLNRTIKRGEFAVIVDKLLDPFSSFNINFRGFIIEKD